MKSKITNNTKNAFLEWLLFDDDTGVSSEAIGCMIILGKNTRNHSYPLDPSDLNRCVKLLDKIPELEDHLDKVAKLGGPVWAELVKNWEALERSLESEKTNGDGRTAPVTYAAMKEYIRRGGGQ